MEKRVKVSTAVVSERGTLTNECVACHSGYRVVTRAMKGEGQ